MFKPSDRFLRAVISLHANKEFDEIREGLRQYQNVILQAWPIMTDDNMAKKFQGRAGLLAELMRSMNPVVASTLLDDMMKKAAEAPSKVPM